MRMPASSNTHTFPVLSVTFQRCWIGSVGTVVGGGAVAVVVGETVVVVVCAAGVFRVTTIFDALCNVLE